MGEEKNRKRKLEGQKKTNEEVLKADGDERSLDKYHHIMRIIGLKAGRPGKDQEGDDE